MRKHPAVLPELDRNTELTNSSCCYYDEAAKQSLNFDHPINEGSSFLFSQVFSKRNRQIFLRFSIRL